MLFRASAPAISPPMRSVRLNPSLTSSLQFSFTLIGGVLTLLLMFDVISYLIKGRSIHLPPLQTLERIVTVLVIVGFGLGVVLFAISWADGTTLSESGLRGPAFWGKPVNIAWTDVASVTRGFDKVWICLIVRSVSSKNEIWLYTAERDIPRIYRQIRAYVGPDHPLAQWLSSNYRINTEA
jgi:hypothetical protein